MVQKYITKHQLIYNVLKCPKDIVIPVNDIDAWLFFPKYNWIYNKIRICQTQEIPCAPIGITPPNFPVFIKPIINLYGMGWGSRLINNQSEYRKYAYPGYFWMPVLKGPHLSYDFILIKGDIKWSMCFQGYPTKDGMFDYWETKSEISIPHFLKQWISKYFNKTKFTGCLNIETINNKIIECHLRMGDINQLHSKEIIKSIINVYKGVNNACDNLKTYVNKKIYLVPIFVNYNSKIYLKLKELRDVCNDIDPTSEHLYSYQLDPPQEKSFNPIGGVRIANINTTNLETGFKVRTKLLKLVQKKQIYKKLLIISYIIIIITIILLT